MEGFDMVRVGGAGLLGQMGERGEKEAGRGQLRWRGVWYGRRSGVVVFARRERCVGEELRLECRGGELPRSKDQQLQSSLL
jgi:hypothetical protein